MFENRKSVNCKVIMPAKAFRINSEEDYDGFDVMCKRGRNCDCEYQNSGYCSCNGICDWCNPYDGICTGKSGRKSGGGRGKRF